MQKMITKNAMFSTVAVQSGDIQFRSNVVVTASNIEEDGVIIGFNYNTEVVHQIILSAQEFSDLLSAMHEIALERGMLQ